MTINQANIQHLPLTQRRSGVLLHIASLPGKYGIGTLGEEAYRFVDVLCEAKCTYWQVLPIHPTAYANSPYQSPSAFAGNPLLINPELLCNDALLKTEDIEANYTIQDDSCIRYNDVMKINYHLLRKAFHNFVKNSLLKSAFEKFCQEHSHWIYDFALFAALKKRLHNKPLQNWDITIRQINVEIQKKACKELQKDIAYYLFEQFIFFKQWNELRNYANERGISIIGDVPIYVSADSVELWKHPHLFHLDKNFQPTQVAGVPPDYFSEHGQLWGNPLYDWKQHETTDFAWWIERMKHQFRLFDVVRMDHFLGFTKYWSIPADSKTAQTGKWEMAPGEQLFKTLQSHLGELSIIAEDLGIYCEKSQKLKDDLQFPGMKVLQFAFRNMKENPFIPYQYEKNCVVYTGTHDNNTSLGWFEHDATEEERNNALKYLHCQEDDFLDAVIRLAWSSVANTVMVPAQDLLELNRDARMNTPGTVKNNWLWKMNTNQKLPIEKIKTLNSLYGREG
jgi:4-alpha-glucanotransferase